MNFKLLFFVLIISSNIFATSGKLMLVGGGGEEIGGWSDAPYSWAVNQSVNKRVAIIAFSAQTTWIPNYFLGLGATAAKNFTITQTNANLQSTYDSLITYDVIFFKGGDQYDYYSNYANTKTTLATTFVFNNGGVICGTSAGMHILSKVLFTAANGSVYPEEAIENVNNTYMTLSNNFLNLFSGYVFDTHFVERARFGRLPGFIANWKIYHNQTIKGLGVDNQTALCIDSNNIGHVYGTAAVNFYKLNAADTSTVSAINGGKLIAKNMNMMQLTEGCTFNFNTDSITGLNNYSNVSYDNENTTSTLFMSASDTLPNNTALISDYKTNYCTNSSRIVIFTTIANTYANAVYNRFQNLGCTNIQLRYLKMTTANLQAFADDISLGNRYVFVKNNVDTLMNVLNNTANGIAFRNKLVNDTCILAFIGDDARLAGKKVLKNYNVSAAAYDGNLQIVNGIGVLKSTVVVPKVFTTVIDVENAASGVAYSMMNDTLKYGLHIYDNTYLTVKRVGNYNNLKCTGNYPCIIYENKASQKSNASVLAATTTIFPRMVSGFDKMFYHTIYGSITKNIFNFNDITTSIAAINKNESGIKIFPNPANEKVFVSTLNTGKFTLCNILGNIVLEGNYYKNFDIETRQLPNGIYYISTIGNDSTTQISKLVISH